MFKNLFQTLSGIAGVSIGIGLSPNEKEVAIVAAAMRDPEAMSKLTKEQVSYINEQILTDGGFVNNKEPVIRFGFRMQMADICQSSQV